MSPGVKPVCVGSVGSAHVGSNPRRATPGEDARKGQGSKPGRYECLVLLDGGARYRVVRVEQPPNERSFGHVWAELI